MRELPSGIPELVKPNIEKIPLHKLRQDLPKLSAKFDPATENWWDTFLGDLENGKSKETTWFLKSLKIAEDALTQHY